MRNVEIKFNFGKRGIRNLRQVQIFLMSAVLALFVLSGTSKAEPYLLAADDKLRLRVVLWDEIERRFTIWSAVSGDYLVQSDGSIDVPLIGPVQAQGQTAAKLADLISAGIQSRIGTVEKPSAAVEIIEYRPFFILGDVNKPGAYPAHPNMNVLQAYALAGGAPAFGGSSTNIQAALRDASALSQVRTDIQRAKARRERLLAEVNGLTELPVGSEEQGGIDPVLREEMDIFNARKRAFDLEIEALEGLQDLLATEITGLETKMIGQIENTRLARQSLENLTILSDRGLTRTPQLAEEQRRLIDAEAKELDLQNLIYRARQRMKEAERDVVELQARRETQAVTELQSVTAELEALDLRRRTLGQITVENGVSLTDDDETDFVTAFDIRRVEAPDVLETDVPISAIIGSGDVLIVRSVVPES